MPLEHDAAPRFTPDQRDEILGLASRLQAQHEATVGADELMRAAQEAGLDPRFVQEAAMRLTHPPKTRRSRAPIVAFLLFVVQAGLFMLNGYFWSRRDHIGLEWPDVAVAVGISLLLALGAARAPVTRRFVPVVPLAVWAALALSIHWANVLHEGNPWWVSPLAFEYAVPQTIAALVGTLLAVWLDRQPKGIRSFQLYRGEKA